MNQCYGAASHGAPFCSYRWYALNGALRGFIHRRDYPGATNDFGQAAQFQQTMQFPSLSGPDTTYCSTILK